MSSLLPDSSSPVSQGFSVAENVHSEVPLAEEPVGETPLVYMNLTPMIDMVFNLLFFFVMGAGGLSEAFLQSKLPVNDGRNPEPPVLSPATITLQIHRLSSGVDESDARYVLVERGRVLGSYEELYKDLDNLPSEWKENASVVIEPAPDVKYTHLLNVYNQATRAGFKKVAFSML